MFGRLSREVGPLTDRGRANFIQSCSSERWGYFAYLTPRMHLTDLGWPKAISGSQTILDWRKRSFFSANSVSPASLRGQNSLTITV